MTIYEGISSKHIVRGYRVVDPSHWNETIFHRLCQDPDLIPPQHILCEADQTASRHDHVYTRVDGKNQRPFKRRCAPLHLEMG